MHNIQFIPANKPGSQMMSNHNYVPVTRIDNLATQKVPEGMKDENGEPYGNNMTMVINQKAKPKGSGKLGKAIIGWDWQRNRYFEETNGTRKYMLDKSSSQIAPNKAFEVDFNDVFKDDTAPF